VPDWSKLIEFNHTGCLAVQAFPPSPVHDHLAGKDESLLEHLTVAASRPAATTDRERPLISPRDPRARLHEGTPPP
jgi:hypothetical protein